MATKVEKNTNTSLQDNNTSELEVLFPDHQITIGDEEITVRELRFAEQLHWQSVLNEIAKSFDEINVNSVTFFEDALGVLGMHADKLLDVVAYCCDKPREWIESLPSAQGEELLITWWTTNNSFFVRRLLRRGIMEKVTQTTVGNQILDGEKSLQPSSEQAIAKNP